MAVSSQEIRAHKHFQMLTRATNDGAPACSLSLPVCFQKCMLCLLKLCAYLRTCCIGRSISTPIDACTEGL